MSRLGLTPHFLAATLFLVAAAHAEEMKPANAPAPDVPASNPMSARAAELLKRFDKNGDGKLDEDERADAHEVLMREQLDRQAARAATLPGGAGAFRARMLEMFDQNHDGRLDDEERAAAQRYAEEHGLGPDGAAREELMRRFDTNHDGKIDDTERPALQKFIQERRAQAVAAQQRLRSELLGRFDTNGNGKIDDDELPPVEKVLRERVASMPAQLARFDRNGDGKIVDEEWAAARPEILRWLNEPVPPVPSRGAKK